MALQAAVLDQQVIKKVSESVHIMTSELSYVVSVNVDTKTSLQKKWNRCPCCRLPLRYKPRYSRDRRNVDRRISSVSTNTDDINLLQTLMF